MYAYIYIYTYICTRTWTTGCLVFLLPAAPGSVYINCAVLKFVCLPGGLGTYPLSRCRCFAEDLSATDAGGPSVNIIKGRSPLFKLEMTRELATCCSCFSLMLTYTATRTPCVASSLAEGTTSAQWPNILFVFECPRSVLPPEVFSAAENALAETALADTILIIWYDITYTT